MKPASRHYGGPAAIKGSRPGSQHQRGVVLIVALILLVVLSLVSAAAIRSSSSSELSTNNSRTQALGMQASEAALRLCETRALNYMAINWPPSISVGLNVVYRAPVAVGGFAVNDLILSNEARTTGATFDATEAAFWTNANSLPQITPEAAPVSGSYRWQTLTNWDGAGSGANITTLASTDINNRADDAGKLYKRYPECMVQYLQAANTRRVVVTARGFGPDVAAIDANRSAPTGAEVWLQSVLTTD